MKSELKKQTKEHKISRLEKKKIEKHQVKYEILHEISYDLYSLKKQT